MSARRIRPGITRELAEEMLDLARHGVDPLGWSGRGASMGGDTDVEAINHMQDLAGATLRGDGATLRGDGATLAIPSWYPRELDAITAGLLETMGLDARGALALACLLEDQELGLRIVDEEGEGDDAVVITCEAEIWEIDTGPGRPIWSSRGRMSTSIASNALASACIGRPLSDVVDLPGAEGATVTAAEGDAPTFVIEVDMDGVEMRDMR